MLSVFNRAARPLKSESDRPERRTVELEAADAVEGCWVAVSELSDPQWTARWIGRDGQGERITTVHPLFQGRSTWGWQGIEIPGSGRWTLVLEYDARDVRLGLVASLVSWTVAIGIFLIAVSWRRRTDRAAAVSQDESERLAV
jgi:hypothetical protein